MDSIQHFMLRSGRFNVRILINFFQQIMRYCQNATGYLALEDIPALLKISNPQQAQFDELAHSSLLLECCLHPTLFTDGFLKFQIRPGISSDMMFFKYALCVLLRKSDGVYVQTIEMFERDSRSQTTKNVVEPSARLLWASKNAAEHSTPIGYQPVENLQLSTGLTKGQELSAPMVVFLARIRRLGMDIIFPPQSHDKVLACIYVSMQVFKTAAAHKEIIDLVIVAKNSGTISDLENVTKTKVRGALAILKHGEIFEPLANLTEPVRLQLCSHVTDFIDLKTKHDSYLRRYARENNVFLDSSTWAELVWPQAGLEKDVKIAGAKLYIHSLQEFYKKVQQETVHPQEYFALYDPWNPSSLVELNRSGLGCWCSSRNDVDVNFTQGISIDSPAIRSDNWDSSGHTTPLDSTTPTACKEYPAKQDRMLSPTRSGNAASTLSNLPTVILKLPSTAMLEKRLYDQFDGEELDFDSVDLFEVKSTAMHGTDSNSVSTLRRDALRGLLGNSNTKQCASFNDSDMVKSECTMLWPGEGEDGNFLSIQTCSLENSMLKMLDIT